MILIDTNILYKFYGYHKNRKNNDNKYDLERLYSSLDDVCLKNELSISIYSLMEVIVRHRENIDYIRGILTFLSDKNIHICNNNRLNFRDNDISDFLNFDNRLQNDFIEKVFERKKEFEVNEFVGIFIPFLKKFILTIGIFFSLCAKLDNKHSSCLIGLLNKYFNDNSQEIKEVLKNNFSIMIENYYKKSDKNENFGLNEVLGITLCSLLFNSFYLTIDFSEEINSIELKEIVKLQRFENPLEYMRKVFKSVVEVPEYSSLRKDFVENYIKEFENDNYPYIVAKYYGNMLNDFMFSSKRINKNDFTDINIIISNYLLQKNFSTILFTIDKNLYDFIKKNKPDLIIDTKKFLINN